MRDPLSPRERPTLDTVAAEAGVARGTVSRVINGASNVHPYNVEAVRAAIARLNYVPNHAARSLAGNKTYVIALFVLGDNRRFVDPFFTAILQGITSVLDGTEYVLNLLMSPVSDDYSKYTRYLESGNVDGALVISHPMIDHYFADLGLPMVFGGQPALPTDPAHYFVDSDNVQGAMLATRHLIANGCRSIGIIAGKQGVAASSERLEGWRQALQEAGLSEGPIEYGDFTMEGGEQAAQRLLDKPAEFDALFASNDSMAWGALAVLKRNGVDVPGTVSVVGFDDSPFATETTPKLTTVRQPTVEMGQAMATTLLRLLDGTEAGPLAHILPTELVVRDSS